MFYYILFVILFMSRKDLSREDISDLESLKHELTSSFDTENSDLFELLEFLDRHRSVSAPVSPNRSDELPHLVQKSVSLTELSTYKIMSREKLEADLRPLKGSRTAHKGWVTKSLNSLSKLHQDKQLNLKLFEKQASLINQTIDKIFEIEEQMHAIYDAHEIDIDDESRSKDSEETHKFVFSAQKELSLLETKLTDTNPANGNSANGAVSNKELLEALSKINNPTTVVLNCQEFYGNETDKHTFGQWLPQFMTIIKANPGWDDAGKLTYLKSKVKGCAKNVIRPINQDEGGFQQAIDALKHYYSNKKANRDNLFSKLFYNKPAFCPDYIKTEQYITETRANLLDLKTHYECDLLDEETGGFLFISHLIFSKLSLEIQNALINKLDTSYPTFTEIYDNHIEIINTLRRNKRKKSEFKDKSFKPKSSFSQSKPVLNESDNFGTSAIPVANSGEAKRYHCRFCNADGHANSYCKLYATLDDRKRRCKDLGLCALCTQPNHSTDKCFGVSNKLKYPCKVCNSRGHVSAMCDKVKKSVESVNVCLSTNVENASNYLLPILRIKMKGHNGKLLKFNALFDTASSRTYISKRISDQMDLVPENVKNVVYDVKTFLGSGTKMLEETSITVFTPAGRYLTRPVLIDDSFIVDLKVRGLDKSIENIKSQGYHLAAAYDEPILALVGTDVIQFIKELKMIDCMNGSAISVASGIIPFGDTNHFLYHGQVPLEFPTAISKTELNFKTVISEISVPSEQSIQFCMNPKNSYPDPAAPFFSESNVERNIDNSSVVANLEAMFSCESVGIIDDPKHHSNYDQEMIAKFESGIEYVNGEINVELLWNEKINDVPSNHNIALKICDLVAAKLERKGTLDSYNQIFLDQEKEGVIEEFNCTPDQFGNYNWLPHHPVYKEDQNSSFKVRPVFNCSIKPDKTKPSLNEAAYVGVNLMQDLVKLLMCFRTNKYTLLGDLRKAFLSIKLKLPADKNKFCFFVKFGNTLKCYRYKTIIFGFCSSPFILNYVLKYIAKQNVQDECSKIINECFFVDNLATSGNDITKLIKLYKDCSERMEKSNFLLRSCNSNIEELRNLMKSDSRYIAHTNEFDKVLGYSYAATRDVMKLAEVQVNGKVNTHRLILSEVAKIFDPLSFTSPVSVRGKLLLQQIWKLRDAGGSWDAVLPGDVLQTWSKLAPDLEGLGEVEFPRYTVSQDGPADLVLFTDASQNAHGYVLYAKQNCMSNYIFSKCKAAPLKRKTLPTLELMGVYIGL